MMNQANQPLSIKEARAQFEEAARAARATEQHRVAALGAELEAKRLAAKAEREKHDPPMPPPSREEVEAIALFDRVRSAIEAGGFHEHPLERHLSELEARATFFVRLRELEHENAVRKAREPFTPVVRWLSTSMQNLDDVMIVRGADNTTGEIAWSLMLDGEARPQTLRTGGVAFVSRAEWEGGLREALAHHRADRARRKESEIQRRRGAGADIAAEVAAFASQWEREIDQSFAFAVEGDDRWNVLAIAARAEGVESVRDEARDATAAWLFGLCTCARTRARWISRLEASVRLDYGFTGTFPRCSAFVPHQASNYDAVRAYDEARAFWKQHDASEAAE